MNREEVSKEILKIKNNNLLITLPTGHGKSKVAIDRVKALSNNVGKLLIVIPRNVLKVNWENEIKKWWKNCKLEIQFTTYVSLPKYAGEWDFVIFDECHHLSERCRESIPSFTIKNSILLSATVKKDLKWEINEVFNDLYHYNVSLRDAIDNKILPDPVVYLLPLSLDNRIANQYIIKNPKAKGRRIICEWKDRWNFLKQKNNPIAIKCTKAQYHKNLCDEIEWYKKKRFREVFRLKWLKLCGDRLTYLSNCKTSVIKEILGHLKHYRTLTFCNSIKHTEELGTYCINSQNKDSEKYLEMFNTGKIKHLTACDMLNEGINLVDCRVGVYANLNSSDILIKQKTGRLLRHKNPVIIIPYYRGTREQEIVEKMLENYNPDLVKTVNFIEEIKL